MPRMKPFTTSHHSIREQPEDEAANESGNVESQQHCQTGTPNDVRMFPRGSPSSRSPGIPVVAKGSSSFLKERKVQEDFNKRDLEMRELIVNGSKNLHKLGQHTLLLNEGVGAANSLVQHIQNTYYYLPNHHHHFEPIHHEGEAAEEHFLEDEGIFEMDL